MKKRILKMLYLKDNKKLELFNNNPKKYVKILEKN